MNASQLFKAAHAFAKASKSAKAKDGTHFDYKASFVAALHYLNQLGVSAMILVARDTAKGRLTIAINQDGNLVFAFDGAEFTPEFGTHLSPIDEFNKPKSPRAYSIYKHLKSLGASHCIGCQIAIYPAEYEVIRAALDNHPENIRKNAEFEAKCNRLAGAERAENKATAWQRDSRYGFGEGQYVPDRADNTPSHKADY